MRGFLVEFWLFGIKQAWACLFGGCLLALIIATHFWWPKDFVLARYDALFIGAMLIQVVLIASRLESLAEAKIIFIFHIVGTVMELFKTSVGSWHYPDDNLIRLGGVPLFSGFMYASVGSYLARVTRVIDMRYTHYPPRALTFVLAAAIYVNFFTHHYVPDIRGFLFIVTGIMFSRTMVYYRPNHHYRKMPLLLGFGLVTIFIWIAENIGTFGVIWLYPHQNAGWHPVGFGKMGSWYLLMMISFILVTLVHPPRAPEQAEPG